ncbi:hypothetical protein RD792_008223 [Penstemon davidsonii]|uniref:Trichome birefringence-like N-terminal domain-containing protein n=1 Tax=Penstemon davidsonii TaxID=160366 RepID=A0ABR0D8F4_9LAMI|nr:hypothetical protein RD792_008223 [Penstemon davidsonii]
MALFTDTGELGLSHGLFFTQITKAWDVILRPVNKGLDGLYSCVGTYMSQFIRSVLEPELSLYTNLISPNPDPLLPSPSGSTQIHEKFDNITNPISSESEFQEEGNEETAVVPILSKPDLVNDDDDTIIQKTSSEPISSDEETNVPISSKSGENIEGRVNNVIAEKLRSCDIYKGRWVKDEDYPLYKPGSCPYVDEAFDCQNNGRPDSGYLNWRWKPDECDLPRLLGEAERKEAYAGRRTR